MDARLDRVSANEQEIGKSRKILEVREEKLNNWATTLSNRENAVQAKFEAISAKEFELDRKLKIVESKQASLKANYKEFKAKNYDINKSSNT
jgi:hypothetical protein